MSQTTVPSTQPDQPPVAGRLPACPYKGLMPYDEDDAAFFFGREAERDVIVANLMAARLTLLYGPSGVGKSSILRAGVARHLHQLSDDEAAERGHRDFVVVVFNAWRDDPVASLEAAVREGLRRALPAEQLEMVPGRLAERLGAWTRQLGLEIFIILDQFEEYFLYHGDEDGEGTFAVEFPRLLAVPDVRVNMLIAIREDALASLDRFEGRLPNLFDNFLRLQHLDREAARAAIEEPVRQFNRLAAPDRQVQIEPALVETLLDQVQTGRVTVGESGLGMVEGTGSAAEERIETPYLQLVIIRLWAEEMAAGSLVLRLTTLTGLGGAQQIVRTHLDQAMGSLSPEDQEIAARVFHHLVTPSGTKIAHTAGDLSEYTDVPKTTLANVLERLSGGDIRILRPIAPPSEDADDYRYEIFHDVLAAAILDWRGRYVLAQERAKADQQHARELEAEARKQREARDVARTERRRARIARAAAAAMALLLVTIGAFWHMSVNNAKAAHQAQHVARSRQLVAEALRQLDVDPDKSIGLSLQALGSSPSLEAEGALRQSLAQSRVRAVLRGHTSAANTVRFSPDGRRLVTSSDDHTARIWDVRSRRQVAVLRGHTKPVTHAFFSPNGSAIATISGALPGAGGDRTARVWDSHTGKQLAVLHEVDDLFHDFSQDGRFLLVWRWDGPARLWDWWMNREVAAFGDSTPGGAAMSRDGRFVVTANPDNRLHLWDTLGQVAPRRSAPDDQGIFYPEFSPDGTTLIAGDGFDRVMMWKWRAGERLDKIEEFQFQISDYRFSTDGSQIVVAGDKTAELYDVESEQFESYLGDDPDWVQAASFSPDGRAVVTANNDGIARVWQPGSKTEAFGTVTAELRGHSDAVLDAAFSPDGKLIATASGDGTARIWQVTDARSLRDDYGWILDAQFSRDGRYIVTAGTDRKAHIWDAKTLRSIRVLDPKGEVVDDASFSRDGKRVLTVEEYAVAPRVWDLATGKESVTLAGTGTNYSGLGNASFRSDGKLVVAGDSDGAVRIWDVRSGRQVRVLHAGRAFISAVDFSPKGRVIVAGDSDRTGWILDASTGKVRQTLRGHTGAIYRARFSPDGKFVVTAGADRTARVWDVATGRQLQTLVGAQTRLSDASFSPNGKLVVAGGADPRTLIWDWASGRTLGVLHVHGDAINSATFSPDGKRILTASDDTTAKVYACETCGSLKDVLRLANERERAMEGR
jgi:WD40 repeat protein